MERLDERDIQRIMDDCKDAALIGTNPKKTFTDGDKQLIFYGCVYDLANDRVATCDVYVEENGKRKDLYYLDYQMIGGDQFKVTETGSIEKIEKEILENKYCY